MNERTTQRVHPTLLDTETRNIQTEAWFHRFNIPTPLRQLWQQNPSARRPYHG